MGAQIESSISLPKPGRYSGREDEMRRFADELIRIGDKVGFRISSRGWGYQLETFGLIDKSKFDMVEALINECRERGIIPIDFTADEDARKFSGVEEPENCSPPEYAARFLKAAQNSQEIYTPDWWDGEQFYIQMLVEKIDLKTLFEPVCSEYHIPIATAKGWSSMLQRAEYARRFKDAEEKGLKAVLLYCGDFDPDGTRISKFLMENLQQLQNIVWADGTEGYDPSDLTIDRFGLNLDFIQANRLTWIDNLITGSKKNLASPTHKNFNMPYVQDWLREVGERKCEANSLVVRPEQARDLCREAIEEYLGDDALSRFEEKREQVREIMRKFKKKTGLDVSIRKALKMIENEELARREGEDDE